MEEAQRSLLDKGDCAPHLLGWKSLEATAMATATATASPDQGGGGGQFMIQVLFHRGADE